MKKIDEEYFVGSLENVDEICHVGDTLPISVNEIEKVKKTGKYHFYNYIHPEKLSEIKVRLFKRENFEIVTEIICENGK